MIQCPQSDFTVPCPEISYCCASAGQRCGQKQGNGEAVRDTVGFGFLLHDHFAVGHKSQGDASFYSHTPGSSRRRQWQSTPVLLPGGSHGRRSLVGCSPWGREESDMTERPLSLFTFHFHALEKEMATHSNVLAWRIPGTGEPGGLPSMGSHRVGHD